MATIVGDVTGLQQRLQPLNIPHLVKKIKGFPLKIKWFQNTETYEKHRGWMEPLPGVFDMFQYFETILSLVESL